MTIYGTSIIAILLSTSQAQAAVTLPGFFSDHMVLQRDAPVTIWGRADVNQKVTVTFAGQSATAAANNEGQWKVELKPMAVSKVPQELTVQVDGGDDAKTVSDVLIGDVWLGSGQSNMAGRVSAYAKNDETLAALVTKAPFAHIRLMQSGPKPSWTTSTPETVSQFSALHFAFGERLHRELDVPIGLIVGAVGGTPSGSWIPPQTFADSKKCQAEVAEFGRTYHRVADLRKYDSQVAAWEKTVAAAEAKGQKPRGRKPTPPAEPGQASRGGKIGGLYERYIEPVAGLRVRGMLWDQGEARSGVVGVDQHTMMSELIRGWREAWGQGGFPFLFVQKPSGGGSAFSNDDPITRNADRFVAAVPDITRIGSGEQRFLYVRLMRDNHNAWMVPASDLGSGIHPSNKWGYGNRAAQVALSQVYKRGIQAYGPIYRSHTIDGGKAIVEFEQVGQGLIAAHDGKLQGFALAGDEGQWHWADAAIEGDTVVLTSPNVPKPTRIRYAFAQNRTWANLFNQDGLPALTFEAGQ
jgi:sialate O-acetylesterase